MTTSDFRRFEVREKLVDQFHDFPNQAQTWKVLANLEKDMRKIRD